MLHRIHRLDDRGMAGVCLRPFCGRGLKEGTSQRKSVHESACPRTTEVYGGIPSVRAVDDRPLVLTQLARGRFGRPLGRATRLE